MHTALQVVLTAIGGFSIGFFLIYYVGVAGVVVLAFLWGLLVSYWAK